MKTPSHKSLTLPAPLRRVVVSRVLSADMARVADLEERVRAGFERGRLEGERALSQQLVRQRQETQQIVQGVVRSLTDAVSQVVRDTEQALIELALEIARKVVQDMPICAATVEAAIREALDHVESNTEISVDLNPADLELLRQSGSTVLQVSGESSRPRFHPSPEVSRGGCTVRTRFGTIDARRETKFELLKHQLTS